MTLSLDTQQNSIAGNYAECRDFYCYAERPYAECRYAMCRGAIWGNYVKHFTTVIYKWAKYRVFIPGKPRQPCTGQIWKGLPGTNTLAYLTQS